MKSPKIASALVLVPLLALGALSCDSGNPVAPAGTILTITASPSRIGLNGTATIIVTGRRPDGNPLATNTEIRFSTSLGTIDAIARTDNQGVARATLQADGRAGTAEVTATVSSSSSGGGGGGGGEGGGGTSGGVTSATISVVVGETPDTAPQVTVTVNPDNIPVGDDSFATITVVVREPDGTAAGAGISVTLTSNLGQLDPTQTATDAAGIATSTLTAGLQPGTATITAFVSAAEPATTTLNIRDAATDISLQPDPTSVSRGAETVQLIAFVSNSQGLPLQGQAVTFETDQGSLDNTVAFTNSNGRADTTLTLEAGDIPDNVNQFEVRALTPTGTGAFIRAVRIIAVR